MRTGLSVAVLVLSLGEQASPLPCSALASCLFQWHFENLIGRVVCVSSLLSLPCWYGALYLVERVSMVVDYTVDKNGSLAGLLVTPTYSEGWGRNQTVLSEISSIYWEDIWDILGALRQCCTRYRIIVTLWPFHLEVECLTPWAWKIIKSPLSVSKPMIFLRR